MCFASAIRASTSLANQSLQCVGGDLCPGAICSRPNHTKKVCSDLDRLLCNVAVSMVTVFIQQEKLKICWAKFDPRQKHLQCLRGSSVGAAVIAGCHAPCFRVSGLSKPPSHHLFLFIPPHISTFWSLCVSALTFCLQICLCYVLQENFCVPAECVFRENCTAFSKESWWITTRPIPLQIMQRIAVGRVSFFIFFSFCSIENQMPDSCRGNLTTAITVLVTGYHLRALWLKLGYQKQPVSGRIRENTGGSNFFQNKTELNNLFPVIPDGTYFSSVTSRVNQERCDWRQYHFTQLQLVRIKGSSGQTFINCC